MPQMAFKMMSPIKTYLSIDTTDFAIFSILLIVETV